MKLHIGVQPIEKVEHINFLGVILDHTITWKNILITFPVKLQKELALLKKVRKYLNSDTLTSLYYSFTWWRHQMETFSALLALCAGNSPVPVNSPHKGQWLGALMFSFIYAWINDWVNNCEAGDLRRQDGHYDVIVMIYQYLTYCNHVWGNTCKTNMNSLVLSQKKIIRIKCRVRPREHTDPLFKDWRSWTVKA